MDEALLARLDADEEVRRDGRSAVLRRAVDAYLRRRQAADIAARYRRAYGASGDREAEWSGWSDEGSWPAE